MRLPILSGLVVAIAFALLPATNSISYVLAQPSEAPEDDSFEVFEPQYEVVTSSYNNKELGLSLTLPNNMEGFVTELDTPDGGKFLGIQIHPEFDSTRAPCCPVIDTASAVIMLESYPLEMLSTPVPLTGDMYAAFQGYNMRMDIDRLGDTEVLVSTLMSERDDLPPDFEPVKRVGKFYFINSDERFLSYGLYASEDNYQKYIDEFESSALSIRMDNAKAVNLDSILQHYYPQLSDILLEDGSVVHPKVVSSSIIDSIEVDQGSKTFKVMIDEPSNSGFLIMSVKDVLAGPHFVTIDGEPQKSKTLSNERGDYLVTFYDKAGPHELAISGSAVMPEFPYHVFLILLAVIGVIIAITRTGLPTRFYQGSN